MIAKLHAKNRDRQLDEIGEWLHDTLNTSFQEIDNNRDARELVVLKYGKRIAKKFTDKELYWAWFQYEPQ